MTDLEAATRALHMHVAGPHLDPHTIEALIRDTYTTRAAGRHLALATADAIAAKLADTPLSVNLGSRARQTAYLLITAALERDPDAGELLDGLDTEDLAHVCIALLGMWRDACAAAAASVLTTTGGTDWPSGGLLSGQEPTRARFDERPVDGSRGA